MPQLDTIRYYDHHAQRLHSHWLKEKSPSDLLPFLEALKPNSRVLDLGCGTGMDLVWLQKAGHRGMGIEGSAPLAEIARTMNPGVEILQQNLMFLSLKEAEFDGIWANQVFQHFPAEGVQRVVATGFRGLKPGGVLGLVVFEGNGSFEDREGDWSGPSREVFLYSEKALCSMLEQTGFRIEKIGRKKENRQAGSPTDSQILVLASRV